MILDLLQLVCSGHNEADIVCLNSNGIQEAPADTLYKKFDES
jgi:hypothetical protein